MGRSPARYDMNLMARTSDHEVLARFLGNYSVEHCRAADASQLETLGRICHEES
jgi:hypothetical protein